MTPSCFFLASSIGTSSWVAPPPLFPLVSLLLSFPPRPLIMRAVQKLQPGSRSGKEQSFFSWAFPSPGWVSASGRRCWACLAEDDMSKASWLWVSIQLCQCFLSVKKLGQVWPKSHSKSSSGICVYSFSPSNVSREPRRPDNLFPHQALISVAWHHFSSPGKELELNFPLSRSNIDLELENNIFYKKVLS